MHIEQSADCL